MKFKHILAFAIHGLTSKSIEEDVNLIEIQERDVLVSLSKDSDEHLSIIDRGLALATLMLKGFFGEPMQGERTRILTEEVAKIQSKRNEQAGGSAILVIDITGDTEVDLSGVQRETEDFVVIFDAIDKEYLRSQDVQIVSSIVASLALSLQRTEPIEKLSDGIYLLDSDGKVYHSFTPSVSASVRLSSSVTPEVIETARFYAEGLRQRSNMASVVRLLNQSIDEGSDTLRSFLSAWTGLEILINKTFSSYESRFIDTIKQGAPSHALDFYLNRVSNVMSDKYRLIDRFIIVSHFLSNTSSKSDLEQFRQIKNIRDQLLHGAEIADSNLPVHETQDILKRYLTKHLRLSKG